MLPRSSRFQVCYTYVLRLVLLSCACLCATAASAQVVGTEAALRQAILDANDTGGPATITLSGNVTLSGSLPLIQADIAFVGAGFTLDAANAGRVFTVGEGDVTITNLTIANARALGGAGGAGSFPGGGSGGMGAAIFIANGTTLTTTNLVIQNASAQGGAGGAVAVGGGGGGGGGFAGPGGATLGAGGGGGGGFAGLGGLGGAGGGGGGGGGALGAWSGDPIGAIGGAGAVGGGGGGGRAFAGGAGADGGGEGGGATAAGASAAAGTGGAGASAEGGDGGNTGAAGEPGTDEGGGGGGGAGAAGGEGARRGGGGGGGAGAAGANGGTAAGGGGAGSGGSGGAGSDFAGGGGGGATGGSPGFGGGGGGGATTGGSAIFGGGGSGGTTPGTSVLGGNGTTAGGGGGAAVGGAIFVEEGAVLTMTDPTFTGTFTVTGGAGSGTAGSGQQQGRMIFTQGGTGGLPLTIDISTDRTISGADALGGGGPRRKLGLGTLTVEGPNPNSAGSFTVLAGAIAGGSGTAFGSGAIVGDGGRLEASGGPRNYSNTVTLLAGGLTGAGAFDVTLSGVVSGAGVLSSAMAPANTLTLTASNLHTTGGTTALSGFLAAAADTNLGAPGAPLTLNGGTFRPLAATTFARPLVLAPGGGIFDTNGFATAWSGPVTGATLNKGGAGVLALSGANTFAAANIAFGTLAVTGGAALADTSSVVVAAAAVLNVAASETIGALTGAGSVQLPGSTLTVASSAAGSFSGVITGTGGLVKTGTGALTLAGVNTFQGPTSLTGGTLFVTGTVPGATTVSAGTLTGSGTLGSVTLTGGEIEPSFMLTLNGNLNVGTSAALSAIINGPTPGTQLGQVRVNGTVTLAGSLDLTFGSVPAPGTSFVLIDNDGTDPVSGTFAGLGEGDTVNTNGVVMRISYTGGSGNDVALIPALFTTYLAEGATNAFFDVRIALVNPSATETANVTLRFLTSAPSVITSTLTLPPLSRRTVNPETIPGLETADFSTVIESNVPVVVDRTMTWDATGYGSHAETSGGAPATVWYFAEGATHGLFDLFYLLQNATTTAAAVEITYLRPTPQAPIVRTYTVEANSRRTIYVDQEDAGLAATDVSAVIRVTNGVPISTERAMYLSTASQPFAAGTAVAGLGAPSTSWFFAEGATGPFFDFFLLLANPQSTEAAVTITYATSGGSVVTRQYAVAGNSRRTISVEQEDPLLQNAAIAATVTVTNAVPVLAERAIFWPAFPWHEGHASAGVTATGTQWALAEGEAGGAADTQTYVLIANTGSSTAAVRVTLLLESGGTLQRQYAIPANSRFNVNTGADFPQAMNQRFGAIVESLGATPQPLVVERSMYTNAGGVTWAAGTNAVATRLQ